MTEHTSNISPDVGGEERNKPSLPRVLILEDEPAMSKLLGLALRGRAEIVANVLSAEEAIVPREGDQGHEVIEGIDILITDNGLAGDMDGVAAKAAMEAEYAKKGWRVPDVIMITGGDDDVKDRARAAGIPHVLGKPFAIAEVRQIVHDLYEKRQQPETEEQ